MFTECPECNTAFRVTAKVLQQAGGRVRCGGCGHAFSALDHLTEDVPGSNEHPGAPPPESAADDLTSDDKFAETSRQLLKTLDDLAGPEEVRIEDTGFEWQVLDDDEERIAAEAGIDQRDKDVAAKAAPTEAAPPEAAPTDAPTDLAASGETAEASFKEQRYDDSTVLHDEEGIAAEAAPTEAAHTDADPTDVAANEDAAAEGTAETDDQPTDLALSEAEDWTDLLEEVDEDEDLPLEVEEELAAIHNELSAKEDSAPVDLDSQFERQAEAMGLEISGTHDVSEEEDIAAEAAPTEAVPEEEAPKWAALTDYDEEGEGFAADAAPTNTASAEDAPVEEAIELSIGDRSGDAAEETATAAVQEVPEPSEEEMTINQQIDADLMAAAGEGQDLTATQAGLEDPEKLFDEDSPGVETIIMEGEEIRGAFEKERLKERKAAALKRFDKVGNLIDSYAANKIIRGGRRKMDPPGYGVIAGTILLTLLLVGQIMHAHRESLSTSALFNQTFGVVYRMLGNPVTPEWSIKGWQFEATNGSVAEDEDVLTIFSRIVNRSEQPLPYPLVHVSLTDRWEEIIGSRVLEPNEYLAGDLNPGRPVIPGENFTAVITIDEPSVEATGFKLNVCYRVSPGRVRCATEDFKD